MKKISYGSVQVFFYSLLSAFTFFSYSLNAQWVRTSGPEGGFVTEFITSGPYFYAGTLGGVYATTNNGDSWTFLNNGIIPNEIYSMTAAGQYVFAGTKQGVFRTSNNGQSWTQTVNGFSSHYDVFGMGATSSIVYAGVWGQGVGVSTDYGNTWVIGSNGLGSNYINDIEVLGQAVFAGTEEGIYKSTDNGGNWILSTQNYPFKKFAVSGTNIFAASSSAGIFVSTDNGNNWTAVNNGLGSTYMFSVAAAGTDLYASSDSMYKSTNNGANWKSASNGLFSLFTNYSLGVNGNTVFTGTFWQGIYRTLNSGGSWNIASNGLKASAMNQGAVYSDGTKIYAGAYYQGVFISQNNGDSWTQVYPTLNVYCFASSGNYRFAGSAGSNIYGNYSAYRSTDNGNSWHDFGLYFTQFTSCMAIKGNLIFAGLSNGGIHRTTLDSPNWEQVIGPPEVISTNALAVSGQTIFAGTGQGVIRSINDGASWDTTGQYSLFAPVTSLLTHNGNIYAGTATDGIYKSTNNGLSWNRISEWGTTSWVYTLSSYNQYIFAGCDKGLFMSSNNGANWTDKNYGFVSIPPVSGLTVLNGYIFAGTFYQSVWRRQISDIININKLSSEIPSGFRLEQNYPNPFNPTTKIRFEIPATGTVKVSVFDAAGREAAVLTDGVLRAGVYETEFNGSGLPSGVYFCRMEAEKFSATRKMILVK